MADGHLERQIRKLRKLYYEKSRLFFDAIKTILGDNVEMNVNESGLHTILTVKSKLEAGELVERALKYGCRVAPIEDYYWEVAPEKLPQVILYFSKIPAAEIKTAIQRLKDAWSI